MYQHEVVRLWCFTPAGVEPLIRTINGDHRWARLAGVPPDQRPPWTSWIRGECRTACESYGEYNGRLGYPNQDPPGPTPEELRRAYRRKHPTWSDEKISRAIERPSRASTFPGRGARVDEQELRVFLRSICAAGPVTFLLDDGGTIDVDQGGSAGLPDSQRLPRMNNAYRVDLRLGRPGDGLPPPYWTPATFHDG